MIGPIAARRLVKVVLLVEDCAESMKDSSGISRPLLSVTVPSWTSYLPTETTISSLAICWAIVQRHVVRVSSSVGTLALSTPLLAAAAAPVPARFVSSSGTLTSMVYVALSPGVLLCG